MRGLLFSRARLSANISDSRHESMVSMPDQKLRAVKLRCNLGL